MHRCKQACKRVGGKLAQWEGMLQLDNIEKQAGWSKSDEMGRNAPTGRYREASGLEQKWRNGKKYSNRKPSRSKRVGAKVTKWEEKLQPEAIEKQACWSKRVKRGRNTPTGSHREASGLEQKWQNGKKCSNRKMKYAGCKFWLPRMGR